MAGDDIKGQYELTSQTGECAAPPVADDIARELQGQYLARFDGE